VGVYDDVFESRVTVVPAGSTVVWSNNGKRTHTVTSADSSWDSGDLAPGASYSRRFLTPGTYHFHCRHHAGMRGTIVVVPGGFALRGGA
jgi:plastocyanin